LHTEAKDTDDYFNITAQIQATINLLRGNGDNMVSNRAQTRRVFLPADVS